VASFLDLPLSCPRTREDLKFFFEVEARPPPHFSPLSAEGPFMFDPFCFLVPGSPQFRVMDKILYRCPSIALFFQLPGFQLLFGNPTSFEFDHVRSCRPCPGCPPRPLSFPPHRVFGGSRAFGRPNRTPCVFFCGRVPLSDRDCHPFGLSFHLFPFLLACRRPCASRPSVRLCHFLQTIQIRIVRFSVETIDFIMLVPSSGHTGSVVFARPSSFAHTPP